MGAPACGWIFRTAKSRSVTTARSNLSLPTSVTRAGPRARRSACAGRCICSAPTGTGTPTCCAACPRPGRTTWPGSAWPRRPSSPRTGSTAGTTAVSRRCCWRRPRSTATASAPVATGRPCMSPGSAGHRMPTRCCGTAGAARRRNTWRRAPRCWTTSRPTWLRAGRTGGSGARPRAGESAGPRSPAGCTPAPWPTPRCSSSGPPWTSSAQVSIIRAGCPRSARTWTWPAGGSAATARWARLAEAARAWREPRYLDAAARAGHYYAQFVAAEYLCGAPEDVDLAPSSEDGYLAVMSYVCLHREQAEGNWLRLAQRAADWTLTFRYTYDVTFPEFTLLGQYGFRTTGADQASPPNQHLHCFGLICLPEMVELYRVTGDHYLLERTRQNLACFRQFIARRDGDFDAYRGMVSERFYQTDCFAAKGMLLTLSHAWTVGVLLYACEAALNCPELADGG